MKFDYAKMVNAPSKDVAQAAFKLVDRLQSYSPEIQSVAAAALFMQVCQVHGVEPQDVFRAAANMAADSIHGERPEFRALRLYTEHELAR